MKAIVTIRTWKDAADPATYKKFYVASEERYSFEAEDLERAELKVLESFPAEKCIGFSIKMENGDFLCNVVKDALIGEWGDLTDEEIKDRLIKGARKRIHENI